MKKIYLLLYYLFAQFIPMQPFPFFKVGYKIRYFFVKRILKSCGKGVIVKNKSYFGNGNKLKIGNHSQLGQNCRIGGPVTIGDYVLMGPDVVIMAVTHDTSDLNMHMTDPNQPSIEKEVVIGNDVWIGTRAILLPGISIGDNCIVGSGAVVTKSFPPYSVIGGVPAKLIKKRE